MKPDIEELRRKYMDNPPEGMTSMDIRRMSEDELLDMDCLLYTSVQLTKIKVIQNFLEFLNALFENLLSVSHK